jgi:two-component system, NtrC family, sensor histidine kinase KinB
MKTKLIIGLAFLFLIIFGVVGICSYYVGRLGNESTAILKDNYDSIIYARHMLAGLDDMNTSILNSGSGTGMSDYFGKLFDSGKKQFEANLKAENGNITEIHEKEYVEGLNRNYDSYLKLCMQIKDGKAGNILKSGVFQSAADRLRQSINEIYDVNTQAVVRKSQLVNRDSSRFLTSMAIVGSICVVLALGYFWYFPVYVSTTLNYLAERIKKLVKSAGLASDIEKNDETFVILHGLEFLENKLGVKSERRRRSYE